MTNMKHPKLFSQYIFHVNETIKENLKLFVKKKKNLKLDYNIEILAVDFVCLVTRLIELQDTNQ